MAAAIGQESEPAMWPSPEEALPAFPYTSVTFDAESKSFRLYHEFDKVGVGLDFVLDMLATVPDEVWPAVLQSLLEARVRLRERVQRVEKEQPERFTRFSFVVPEGVGFYRLYSKTKARFVPPAPSGVRGVALDVEKGKLYRDEGVVPEGTPAPPNGLVCFNTKTFERHRLSEVEGP